MNACSRTRGVDPSVRVFAKFQRVWQSRLAQRRRSIVAADSTHPSSAQHMPELSRFLGIVIAMYYRDHRPAHFHAIYGNAEATVEIVSGKVRGDLPHRALAHVHEWRLLH